MQSELRPWLRIKYKVYIHAGANSSHYASGICLVGSAPLESVDYSELEHSIQHFPAFAFVKMWGIAQETDESLAPQPAKQLPLRQR
jgi:hypothetical protein